MLTNEKPTQSHIWIKRTNIKKIKKNQTLNFPTIISLKLAKSISNAYLACLYLTYQNIV